MATISIIVPIYNVENYLRKCVDSLINQTFKDLEIILVDDGSPDSCPAICDEYAIQDSRIKVVHKKNGGLSSARNAGIDVATGLYLTFVDSDDWIEVDTLEYAYSLITKYNSDVVEYSLTETENENAIHNQLKEKIDIYFDKAILQYYMYSSTVSGSYSVCRCLFKVTTFKDIRFREGKINEDMDVKYKVLSSAHKMVVSNQKKYFYRQGRFSISMGGLCMKDFDLRESSELLCKLTSSETYGDIAFLGRVKKARTALSLLCKVAYFGFRDDTFDKEQTINDLTKENRRNIGILLKAPLPFSRKVLAVMFAINFKFTRFFVQIAKRFSIY